MYLRISAAVLALAVYLNWPGRMDMNKNVDDLFKRFWDWRLKDSPEFATFSGIHTYDDVLQSYSIESFAKRKVSCQSFLDEANNLYLEPNIDPDTKLNLELFIYELSIYLKGLDSKGYMFPLNFLEGVHIEFERLITTMPQECAEDFRKILSRFQKLPEQISEIIKIMGEGIRLKMTYSTESMKGILEQLDNLQKEPEETDFYKPFKTMPDSISDEEKESLLHAATKSISEDILPAFRRLHEFLEKEYMKHLRSNIGASSLPNGKDFYQLCLDFHLGFHMTPEEVHEQGLNEVSRISKEIEKVIETLGLAMSLRNFSQRMREDKDFYFNNSDELLEAYKGLVFKKLMPKIPEIIKEVPKSKLVIEPVPSSMSGGPSAYYLAGTFDGRRPGVFYVNNVNLEASPKYDMMTLALHEAVPGHHTQLSFLMELKNVPDFRRYIEDRKYSEAPSRFPLHTAFCEGWGLYSEYLGYELGMYDDTYFNYGHLSYEMFRACRLVVDTGMHAMGWSRDRAINYMMEHTALHRNVVESEINRYITWPGQACAYKIGEMKIKDLREEAEKALGPAFSVKEFHDVVLRSSGPLNILEQKVTEFIRLYSS